VNLGHRRDVGGGRPSAKASGGDHGDKVTCALHHDILIADGRRSVDGRRSRRKCKIGSLSEKVRLEKALNSGQALQNELVSGIKFDSRLPVYTLCSQLRAKFALWLCSVASRFS